MNITKQIEKHEAAITHLKAIQEINHRIVSDTKYYNNVAKVGISVSHTRGRIRINKAILNRITKSYKRLY